MGRKRKKTQFEESLLRNQNTYFFYLRLLTELSMSRFKYKNLPDTVDERYIELKLFENGQVVYFRDEVIGDLCLSVIPNGNFDCYGIPINRRAYSGYNNYMKELTNKDSVIIFNNFTHTNSILCVEQYATKLWLCDRTIDVNINAQKTPILITCSEPEKLTMENVYKEYDGNTPAIFAYKGFDVNNIKALKTGADFVSDKVYEIKAKLWNEALTYLGISNLSFNKRAQTNVEEVTRSLGGVFGFRNGAIMSRQNAIEKINKMFGTNIEVCWCEPLSFEERFISNEYTGLVGGEIEDV